jgi:hypothetical protein
MKNTLAAIGHGKHWERSEKALIISSLVTFLIAGISFCLYQRTNEAAVFPPIPPIPAPPSPNAYDFYTKAGAALVRPQDIDLAIITYGQGKLRPLPPKEKAKLVADNRQALTLFRQGLKHPYGYPFTRSSNAPSLPFVQFRQLARLISLEAQTRAVNGDYAGVTQSSLDQLQFGMDMPRSGGMLPGMIGLLVEGIDRKPFWEATKHVNATDARAAALRLERLADNRVPFADILREDKWFVLTLMSQGLNHGSLYGFYQGLQGTQNSLPPPTEWRDYARVLGTNKQQLVNNYTAHMDRLIAEAEKPYTPHPSFPEPPQDPITPVLIPNMERAWNYHRGAHAQHSLFTAAFALRAYSLEHQGAFPANLNDLVTAGYLHKQPSDPFASTPDTPLRYHRTAKGYALYSVGPDGVDNNGTPFAARYNSGRWRWRHADGPVLGDLTAGVNWD